MAAAAYNLFASLSPISEEPDMEEGGCVLSPKHLDEFVLTSPQSPSSPSSFSSLSSSPKSYPSGALTPLFSFDKKEQPGIDRDNNWMKFSPVGENLFSYEVVCQGGIPIRAVGVVVNGIAWTHTCGLEKQQTLAVTFMCGKNKYCILDRSTAAGAAADADANTTRIPWTFNLKGKKGSRQGFKDWHVDERGSNAMTGFFILDRDDIGGSTRSEWDIANAHFDALHFVPKWVRNVPAVFISPFFNSISSTCAPSFIFAQLPYGSLENVLLERIEKEKEQEQEKEKEKKKKRKPFIYGGTIPSRKNKRKKKISCELAFTYRFQ